ncbi:glycosyltransferase [Tamlana sp. 2201CG12-4]|uniref:glycosyltransferase n=1 Tax=Tamlana sp. 2201CG12-4 TaxID=3112582 RepID=UPI002DBA7302|nr:glycosyltransferase [Tamlana sp. 2201CG12-4]MEC3907246.1 glycosyltransferase [Tamlana sp. 2201CG12-4]
MKILLIGEYSRLHNSLKEGLVKNDHEVLLIGSGDGFKNYPVDFNIAPKSKEIPFLLFFIKVFYKIFKFDLSKIEIAFRLYKLLPKLKDYDIVQLINEDILKTFFKFQIWFFKKIIEQNGKLFLLSCGTDYISVKYAFEKKPRYSILTPYFNNPNLKKKYKYILKYISKQNYQLHKFLYQNIEGVFASDIDYHIPLQGKPKYLGLVPNPINIHKLNFTSLQIVDRINIFHGINSENSFKKGSSFFEQALINIQSKYPEKVSIRITKDVPYKEYISLYDSSHIILDQVYSFDQGYNALEAMAKGKVVFTGAEKEWLELYNLEEDSIAINALPDVNQITHKLEWLILNPSKIVEISKSARAFIEREHDYIKITNQYVKEWTRKRNLG